MEDLKDIKSLQEQVIRFTKHVQAPLAHINKCNRICMDLLNTFRNVYPYCHIHQFGSSITGLCFCGSDVDIYISGIRKQHQEDIRHLYRLKHLLNNSNMFHNILVIGQAKIPILKCVHTATNTNCDINIRNKLGLCNSRLISYYLNIDVKLKQMMLIIKYWAKVHRITGQNHLFTNYSFCMMIIFYLQGNPYNLPSVKYLQSDPAYTNRQDDWNGGFQCIKAFCPHVRSSSLLDLLSNFFSYYAEFDYGTYVICPFLGRPVKKSDFKDPDGLPQGYDTYKSVVKLEGNRPLKVDATICVQDPFEHTRNITPIVSESTLDIFVKFCKHAKKLTEQGETGFLYKLFTQTPPNAKIQLLAQTNFIQFGVEMGTSIDYIRRNVDVNDESKDLWFDSVKRFALIALRNFCNMTVTEEGVSGNKRQKMNEHSDVTSDFGNVIGSFKCSATLNVWHNRPKSKQDRGIVEQETEITKKMLEMYKNIDKVKIIEFSMVLERRIEPAQVIFSLTKINCYKKVFKTFGKFFSTTFGKWFAIYEKELNRNVESN
ncbi:terminal uridylyltransferase Tailor-like [Diorhabda sublineata]|uniref:terminal uridylyltransferase Tailor-like n=1 Tax=Diorhabda sublineata TaxID=1163346 RepID=UPI0024E09040|nr:terminal uridylyltransferase Tailor-like [Diorhabda sublineata]